MGQRIHVITRVNPLRLLMTRPSSLNCKLVKWAIFLSQYEMQFMPQKATKCQAVTDVLADHPVSRTSKLYDDFLYEITEVNLINASSEKQVWQLFFDRASRTSLEGNIVADVGSTHFPT